MADLKNKRTLKKILFPALLVALVLLIVSTRETHAQGVPSSFLIDVAGWMVGKLFFYIGYIMAWVAGVFIGIEAWIVGAVLNMNTTVFDTAIVQTGFGISLAIANLGFVLGIIIIAIATILRRESYGIKQLLWKLVVAAILVNFGLVIIAPIFSFSNSLTQWFLNCIDPTAGGCGGNGNGLDSMNHFAESLAGAFNPQNGFISTFLPNNTNPNDIKGVEGAFAAAQTGGQLSLMLVPIFSLFFVAAYLTVVVITLGALIMMLLIRYVYIAVLAVLMPFAWLMWVFPKLSHHWSKWWSNFIKWTFFAPIVVFFLYLAIITAQAMSQQTGSLGFAVYTSNSNTAWAGIVSLFTSIFSPIIQNALNEFVLVGLSIGGIFAANSMGIAGADVAMKAVGAVKDSAVGYVGKQTKKGGRFAYRKADQGVSALSKRMGGTGAGITQRLQGSRIRPLAIAGRNIAAVQDNRALIEAAAKNVPNDKQQWMNNIQGSMSDELRMAYLQKGAEKGWVRRGMKVDGVDIGEFLDKNKAKFGSYGQAGEGGLEETLRFKAGLLQKDIDKENEKLAGENAALDAQRASVSEDGIKTKAGLSDADMEFYSTAKRADVDANFMEEDKKRWYDIEAKANKAKQELGLPEKEQNKYDDNKDKIEGNKGKIARLMLKDPETTGGAFFDDEKARARFLRENPSKEVPDSLKKENIDRERAFIIQTVAEKFSASNARALFDAIAKANNLPSFEAAVNNVKENQKDQFALVQSSLKQNKDLRLWMQNNAGKALFGGLKDLFNLPGLLKKRKRKDGTVEIVEETTEEEGEEAPKPTT